MEQFTNAASTTLNGTIASGTASLVVTSATSFPAYAYFRIRVEQEIMIVTAVSGSTFTVTRGAEGTTAAAHNTGVQVVHIVTAQALASSNWNIGFDLDFTSLTTATYSTDGTFTFTGAPASANYTWTKGNSTNEVTHSNILNGTGLNFQPASTSDYNGSTRTLPYIWLPFAQVFPAASYPNYGWSTKLRLWVSFGTDNITAEYDNEVFGIDSNSTAYSMLCKRGYGLSNVTGNAMLYTLNAGNSNNFVTDAFTLGTGNRTWMIEFECPAAEWYRPYRGTSLAAGASFPALSSLTPTVTNYRYLSPNTSISNFSGSGVSDPLNGLGIFLGAQRAASGTALSLYYQRVRLDYKFQE